MQTKKIFTENALYQHLIVLKTNRNKRYKNKEFLIEGVRNINEAVKNRWHINSLVYPSGKLISGWAIDMIDGVKTDYNIEIIPELFNKLSDKTESSELLAVVSMRDDNFLEKDFENPLILLFDRPSNKGNLGTIIRSCDAFGIDGLITTGHCVDLYDPEVVGATMGSFFSVPYVRITSNDILLNYISEMKEKFNNLKIIGTTSHKKNDIYSCDLTGPVIIMIGNETDGLNNFLSSLCDLLVTIPMAESSSASSLNVACAATVFLYESVKQRSLIL